MDAFEQLAAELLFANGWWVQTSVKVELTKEEKIKIGRPSCPRWELDVVAYRGATNEILVIECKSFLDSRGVQWSELQSDHGGDRYKMFTEPVLREVVLARLATQMIAEGRCAPNPTVRLGMIAGKLKSGDEERLPDHFKTNDWEFFGPGWLRDQLSKTAASSYNNQVSAIVAKLLLRGNGAPSKPRRKSYIAARSERWTDDTPLKLLIDYNPKKPGSKAHEHFQGYFSPDATTLGGALKAGVRMVDIRHDRGKGFISLG